MKLEEVKQQIQAILFASGEPIEISRIALALELDEETVEQVLEEIKSFYQETAIPFRILRLEDKVQMCTGDEYTDIIRKAIELKRNIPLSQAAMEVLTIIAYNQPVTRGFIEQIRGVDSSSVVSSLVDKRLVEEMGRLDLPGKPIAYRTTPIFLRSFGLNDLSQLPQIELDTEEEASTEGDNIEGQISFASESFQYD